MELLIVFKGLIGSGGIGGKLLPCLSMWNCGSSLREIKISEKMVTCGACGGLPGLAKISVPLACDIFYHRSIKATRPKATLCPGTWSLLYQR